MIEFGETRVFLSWRSILVWIQGRVKNSQSGYYFFLRMIYESHRVPYIYFVYKPPDLPDPKFWSY